jgi:D-alanyl-D-alanine-carboxypeptidase/D-alanyl-D-alanine-endopeptidase
MIRTAAAIALLLATSSAAAQSAPAPRAAAPAAEIAAAFDRYMADQHIPGLVYGVVRDGRLILVRGAGVQDVATNTPVTADSLFRIASMSKAFTALSILNLRDAGKLSLDDPAERYLPQMRSWRYPTEDAPKITVRALLTHSAGYVEDNPWGDRQQPLTEGAFTAMLKAGVPFATGPGLGMEYSNFGYATLGRIVGNVSGMPYQRYVGETLMTPLKMNSTGYDIFAASQPRRALGYRWQNEAWVREPDMADGAFGAMGGVQTSANDYAKWVAFLLSGWPARDGADAGPVKRSTVREIVQGANFATTRQRPAALGAPCRWASTYAMAWNVIDDCDLGRVVTHTGGYPGYGSVVALLPDAGIGVFAFANRTYAAPSLPALQALMALKAAGLADRRPVPVSAGLSAAYAAARAAWVAGGVERAPIAVNVLLDRTAMQRRREIVDAKAKVGSCATDAPIAPISAMEGRFTWACATGTITGRVQRAPTPDLSLQVIDFMPS